MNLEQQARLEMKRRKTRHYRRQQLKEIVTGIAVISLGIVAMLGWMIVFPD